MIKKNLRVIIGIIFLGLLVMQIFKSGKNNPPVDPKLDLIASGNAPQNIRLILKNSCYDCHSHETVYPWYFDIAPVSWILNDHIMEGREKLNFSEWQKYPLKKKKKYILRAAKFIENGEMPLWNYRLIHTNANLNDPQKKELTDWLKSLKVEPN